MSYGLYKYGELLKEHGTKLGCQIEAVERGLAISWIGDFDGDKPGLCLKDGVYIEEISDAGKLNKPNLMTECIDELKKNYAGQSVTAENMMTGVFGIFIKRGLLTEQALELMKAIDDGA